MSSLAIGRQNLQMSATPLFKEGCGADTMIGEIAKIIGIALVILPALAAALSAGIVSGSLMNAAIAGGIGLGVMSTLAFAFIACRRG